MTDFREVYAANEGDIFVYTAAAGTTGTAHAFVQDVRVDLGWQWDRQLSPVSGSMRSRVTYTLKDTPLAVSFRALFRGLTFLLMAQSATAINADLQFSAMGGPTPMASAAFRCLSGRIESFALGGEQGGLWEAQVGMQFAELSAYWV